MNNLEKSKNDTMEHKRVVQQLMTRMSNEICKRGEEHDNSKLEEPELSIFAEYGPKLKESKYGSDEYYKMLKEMNVALDHHYKENRHHPEHFKNGMRDMDLLDLLELICDWKASTLRHDTGDLLKSIDINQKRFGYSDDIKDILKNTAMKLYKFKVYDGKKILYTDNIQSTSICTGRCLSSINNISITKIDQPY